MCQLRQTCESQQQELALLKQQADSKDLRIHSLEQQLRSVQQSPSVDAKLYSFSVKGVCWRQLSSFHPLIPRLNTVDWLSLTLKFSSYCLLRLGYCVSCGQLSGTRGNVSKFYNWVRNCQLLFIVNFTFGASLNVWWHSRLVAWYFLYWAFLVHCIALLFCCISFHAVNKLSVMGLSVAKFRSVVECSLVYIVALCGGKWYEWWAIFLDRLHISCSSRCKAVMCTCDSQHNPASVTTVPVAFVISLICRLHIYPWML